ncbi:MAG: NAD(P)H-dependent glycerol-3-phosphate dehydrogenase, partial [Rhodospirillales bacterium]
QFLRATLEPLRAIWPKGVPIVLCCKGIEQGSGMLMSEVATDVLGDKAPIAVLSGPTFAAEVARGLPTAVTVAMEDFAAAEALSEALAAPTFRTYAADDVIGAEVGGAVKNVLAIGCGIVEGHGLGDNARAALITRGVAEIARLSQDLGGRPETLLGLCGMGDITLTCNAMQSRNFSLGHALGRGRKLADVLAERVTVAEGVSTAASVSALADKRGIDMPIAKAVDAILHKNAGIEFCIQSLLNRPLKPEIIADPDIMAG